jgi:hypothetical protein
MHSVTWSIKRLAYSSKKYRKTEKRRTSQSAIPAAKQINMLELLYFV